MRNNNLKQINYNNNFVQRESLNDSDLSYTYIYESIDSEAMKKLQDLNILNNGLVSPNYQSKNNQDKNSKKSNSGNSEFTYIYQSLSDLNNNEKTDYSYVYTYGEYDNDQWTNEYSYTYDEPSAGQINLFENQQNNELNKALKTRNVLLDKNLNSPNNNLQSPNLAIISQPPIFIQRSPKRITNNNQNQQRRKVPPKQFRKQPEKPKKLTPHKKSILRKINLLEEQLKYLESSSTITNDVSSPELSDTTDDPKIANLRHKLSQITGRNVYNANNSYSPGNSQYTYTYAYDETNDDEIQKYHSKSKAKPKSAKSPKQRQSNNNNPRVQSRNINNQKVQNQKSNSPRVRNINDDSPRVQNQSNNSPRVRNINDDSPRIQNQSNNSPRVRNINDDSPRIQNLNIDNPKVQTPKSPNLVLQTLNDKAISIFNDIKNESEENEQKNKVDLQISSSIRSEKVIKPGIKEEIEQSRNSLESGNVNNKPEVHERSIKQRADEDYEKHKKTIKKIYRRIKVDKPYSRHSKKDKKENDANYELYNSSPKQAKSILEVRDELNESEFAALNPVEAKRYTTTRSIDIKNKTKTNENNDVVKIKIVEDANVPSVDRFCVFYIEGDEDSVKRTKTIHKGQNQFNESFEYPLNELTTSKLVIFLKKQDLIKEDKIMGTTKIDLQKVPQNSTLSKWIPLKSDSGVKIESKLHLVLKRETKITEKDEIFAKKEVVTTEVQVEEEEEKEKEKEEEEDDEEEEVKIETSEVAAQVSLLSESSSEEEEDEEEEDEEESQIVNLSEDSYKSNHEKEIEEKNIPTNLNEKSYQSNHEEEEIKEKSIPNLNEKSYQSNHEEDEEEEEEEEIKEKNIPNYSEKSSLSYNEEESHVSIEEEEEEESQKSISTNASNLTSFLSVASDNFETEKLKAVERSANIHGSATFYSSISESNSVHKSTLSNILSKDCSDLSSVESDYVTDDNNMLNQNFPTDDSDKLLLSKIKSKDLSNLSENHQSNENQSRSSSQTETRSENEKRSRTSSRSRSRNSSRIESPNLSSNPNSSSSPSLSSDPGTAENHSRTSSRNETSSRGRKNRSIILSENDSESERNSNSFTSESSKYYNYVANQLFKEDKIHDFNSSFSESNVKSRSSHVSSRSRKSLETSRKRKSNDDNDYSSSSRRRRKSSRNSSNLSSSDSDNLSNSLNNDKLKVSILSRNTRTPKNMPDPQDLSSNDDSFVLNNSSHFANSKLSEDSLDSTSSKRKRSSKNTHSSRNSSNIQLNKTYNNYYNYNNNNQDSTWISRATTSKPVIYYTVEYSSSTAPPNYK